MNAHRTRPDPRRAPGWRGWLLAAVIAAVAAVTAGCRVDVATTIDVTSATTATIQLAVSFEGEIAEQMRKPANQQDLQTVFAELSGNQTQVTIQDDGTTVTWTTPVPYALVETTGEITGVGRITLTPGENDTTTVTVDLVEPTRLAEVIANGIASQGIDPADGAAMAETALKSTFATVTVTTAQPGRVSGSLADAAAADGTNVTVTQDLAEWRNGQLAVTASTSYPSPPLGLIAAGIAAAAAVTVAGIWIRRR